MFGTLEKYLTTLVVVAVLLLGAPVHAKRGVVGEFDYYVLAISWQSAFCELNAHKQECSAQKATDFSASNFVLHGLWPNKRNDKKHRYAYCGLSKREIKADKRGRWCDIPFDQSKQGFDRLMPGVKSCLHVHEWLKHGVCSGLGYTQYFDLSFEWIARVSNSPLGQFMSNNIGKKVTRQQLQRVYHQTFGDRAARPGLVCKRDGARSLLVEMRILLRRDIEEGVGIKEASLFDKAPKIRSRCGKHFYIDAVGYQ